MALAHINFYSTSLGLSTAMSVLLPDAGPGPFPVFYLLHGLSDDHTMWLRRTRLERYVHGLPLIVVMPETARQWYTNSATLPGRRYEDHIMLDVLPTVDRLFPTLKAGKARAIGGLSMGGYGALKLALKFPDTFCSATSHSGVTMGPFEQPGWRARKLPDSLRAEINSVFGPNAIGSDNDPVALAEKCPKSKRPALRIDCGKGDLLIPSNRMFHQFLNKLKYKHEYHEYPGEHTWSYWDARLPEAIAFHRKQLNIKEEVKKL